MKRLTLEQYIYRDYRRFRRKYSHARRWIPRADEIRLILARKYKMSCRQIKVIYETEKLLVQQ